MTLRLEGGTLSMGGSVSVYSGAILEVDGVMQGQSAEVAVELDGGEMHFEGGTITGMTISTMTSGHFSFVSEQAHTFDNTELTCSSTAGE